MKYKYFDNTTSLNIFLKNNILLDRYTITIKTMPYEYKRSLKVEYGNGDNLTIYINQNVTSLYALFKNNKKINKFIFDDWDSSNIKQMRETFRNIELDKMPDFSKLDLSNLEETESLFNETKIKGDLVFINHTLKKLIFASSMFSNIKCDNLTIDMGETSLKDLNYFLSLTECESLKININKFNDNGISFIAGLKRANIDTIDLTNFNIPKETIITDMLSRTNIKNKLIMPNNVTVNDDIGVVSNKINRIYCNKEWAKILKR